MSLSLNRPFRYTLRKRMLQSAPLALALADFRSTWKPMPPYPVPVMDARRRPRGVVLQVPGTLDAWIRLYWSLVIAWDSITALLYISILESTASIMTLVQQSYMASISKGNFWILVSLAAVVGAIMWKVLVLILTEYGPIH